MTSLRNLAILKILESMRAKENPNLKTAMKSAVVQSDPLVRDLLKRGVKRRSNEIGTKNLVKHTYLDAGKTKKKFLNKASVRNVFLISIPNNELYNNSMPRGNVKFANPEKVMTEANFRRYGGHYKMSTTNGQKFVYVPYEYVYEDRMSPPFHILKTTENTLRSIPGASIDKPPSKKPPINFKLSKIDKEYYNSRTTNTKTSKKNIKK